MCVDAGTSATVDAGTPATVDAGTRDAGAPPVDAGSPPPSPTVSFSGQVQPIFNNRCVSCHGASLQYAGLNLSVGLAWSGLVSVNTSCNLGVPRVTPGSLQNSMLWRKLADTSDKCGSAMPLGTSLKAAFPDELKTIETWIREGALNN
jgi:hypothetical protein